MKIVCGGLTFFSDFDSGNLDKVEFVAESTKFSVSDKHSGSTNSNFLNTLRNCKSSIRSTVSQAEQSKSPKDVCKELCGSRAAPSQDMRQKVATAPSSTKTLHQSPTLKKHFKILEFNVWTKPDCSGTQYENLFRSWFHFGIQGASLCSVVKINVMNSNRQGKLYFYGMRPVFKVVPGKGNWKRIPGKVQYRNEIDGNFVITFSHLLPNQIGSTIYFAFTYPFTYSECDNMLSSIDKKMGSSLYTDVELPHENSIYYSRELLAYSLDGRRIELLTITSFKGFTHEREERLPNLFPDESKPRCHIFCDKKVIFMSSRVHPGETPSSFVFNGFIQSLLCSKDPKSSRLRNLFVFKLIPMLNPDGVWRGHFRTDSHGVNLNRTYIIASPEVHPSIYAARSMLLYYHTLYSVPQLQESPNVLKENQNNIIDKKSPDSTIRVAGSAARKPSLIKASSEIRLPSPLGSALSIENYTSANVSSSDSQCNVPVSILGCDALLDRSLSVSDFCLASSNRESSLQQMEDQSGSLCRFPNKSYLEPNSLNCSDSRSTIDSPKPEFSPPCGSQLSANVTAFRSCSDLDASDFEEELTTSPGLDQAACSPSTLVSDLNPECSGIAYYFDLHGHACKRGCFFYGNYFSDIEQKIECMLLAKLMSINSPYFDFGACNFSAENMRAGGKKDGLTKEGSGRVSLNTFTGIIRSYTLECNYNTGRSSLHREASPGKPLEFFSPEIYQQVGEALLTSILDASGRNTNSYVPHSSLGSLQGVRDWLRNYILSVHNKSKNDFLRKNIMNLRMGKFNPKEKSVLSSPTPLMRLNNKQRESPALKSNQMSLNIKRNLKSTPVSSPQYLSNFGMQYKRLHASNPSLENFKAVSNCLDSLKNLLAPRAKSFNLASSSSTKAAAIPLKKSKGQRLENAEIRSLSREPSSESSAENLSRKQKSVLNKSKVKDRGLDDVKVKKLAGNASSSSTRRKLKKKNFTNSDQAGPADLLKTDGNVRMKKAGKKTEKH